MVVVKKIEDLYQKLENILAEMPSATKDEMYSMQVNAILKELKQQQLILENRNNSLEKENKLLHTANRFTEIILGNTRRLIVTLSPEGNIIQINKTVEDFTGKSLDELNGVPFWKLACIDQESVTQLPQFLPLLSGQSEQAECENVWMDIHGERRHIRWEFVVVKEHEKPDYIIGWGDDITESQKKEDHIIKLSAAIEQSANAVMITDLNGNIEYANPRFYDITGYSPPEVLGKNPRLIKYENSVVNYKEMWATISSGKIWEGEFLNKNKSGEIFWDFTTITPIKNTRGEIMNYLAIKEDITQRKKTEEQLIKAHSFYLNLLKDFPVMVWQSDTKGVFNFFNNTWLEFTGKTAEQEYCECTFRNIHPDEKVLFCDAFSESLKKQQPFLMEYRLKDRFDNYRWMLSHGKPFTDQNGNFGGFIGTCVDIHDRVMAEEKLTESENNYRRMFEDSSLGIFRLNKSFDLVAANKSFAHMFGFESPVDFLMEINNNPQEYFKEYASEIAFRKQIIRSKQNHFVVEREFYRKDKALMYAVIHLRKVNRRSAEKEFFLEGFIEDITDRKIIEKNLKSSEQKFRVLFEKSYDAICILSNDQIVDCNQKAIELFQLPCHELYHKTLAMLSPENQINGVNSNELLSQFIQLALQDYPQHFEWLLLCKGKMFDAEVSLSKVVINDRVMVQAVIRDISEKKRVEKQLKRAKNEAEKARTAQSEFLSLMSHEIRTPLNAVVALTDLILQDKLTGEQRENLDSVKLSARHLLGLIDDILDYNKIESGNIQFEESPFEVRALIFDLKRTLMPKARENGIDLIVSIDEKIPSVLVTDTLRLKQILYNLLSNAIKFTNKGNVTLHIYYKSEYSDDNRIFFQVNDTGIGISEDRLTAIFERFTQAEISTSRKYGGSGLGLSICKKLVEMQGGEIVAESEIGKGSKFTFFIPMDRGQDALIQTLINMESQTLPDIEGVKILLVEDDQMNQFVARKLIEKKWKAELTLVNNGEQALIELENNHFDLVLMDLQMPGLDGYQTTRIIRENRDNKFQYPDIPIIALTADAFLETRKKAYEAGVSDFITKPFDYNSLLKKINFFAKANPKH